jgi:hypothetical protein
MTLTIQVKIGGFGGGVLRFFFIGILLTICSPLAAQDIRSHLLQDFTYISSEKNWNFNAIAVYNSNLHKNSDPDHDSSTSLVTEAQYSFSKKTKLYGRVDVIHSFNEDETTKFSDTVIVLTPWTQSWSRDLQFHPDASIILPTDKDEFHDQSFRGALSLRPTVDYQTPWKWLSISNILFLTRNFHAYTQNRDFSPNVEYSMRERFVIGISPIEKLRLELTNDYVRAWTYSGYEHDAFYFGQEFSYEFQKSWMALLGHKNEGAVNGPNNQGENVAFYDAKTSYITVGLGHEF